MASLVFLFPGSNPLEALDNWVRTVGRHTDQHRVFLAREALECRSFDATFVLTEGTTYPRHRVDQDLQILRERGVPFAVLHNHDNPAVPSPGPYPSFCWTRQAQERLLAQGIPATLLRQPLFRPLIPYPGPDAPQILGTFGHIEPKKQTWEMAYWCGQHGLTFRVVGPDVLLRNYASYLRIVRDYGAQIAIHPWMHHIEELAPYVEEISHFLFVLPPSKDGTGGSPTSPRYATFWNRPVLVVDNEDTFSEDGFHVYRSFEDIDPQTLGTLARPFRVWTPDRYLEQLYRETQRYWKSA